MKRYKNSVYLVSEDGKVINRSNRNPIKVGVSGLLPLENGKMVLVSDMVAELFPLEHLPEKNVEQESGSREKNKILRAPRVVHEKKQKSAVNRFSEAEQNNKFKGYYFVNGVQYPSIRLAAKVTGIPATTIRRNVLNNVVGFSFSASLPLI